MDLDLDLYINSVISLLVITAAFDPVKIIFFNKAVSHLQGSRVTSAARVALYIIIILGGSALIGRGFLNILGIDLDAFSAVGGLIITLIGFEMLYGGDPSMAQGENVRERGPEEDDSLLLPLTLPLIAGPGAITTTITIASQENTNESVLVALIGVCVVAISAFVSFAWLGDIIGKAKPTTVSLLVRIGGLLLATIGAQMMLNGIKNFFS